MTLGPKETGLIPFYGGFATHTPGTWRLPLSGHLLGLPGPSRLLTGQASWLTFACRPVEAGFVVLSRGSRR